MSTLIDYLKQLQDRGETHIYVDDEATTILRDLYIKSTSVTSKPAETKATPTAQTSTTPPNRTSPKPTQSAPPISKLAFSKTAHLPSQSSGSPGANLPLWKKWETDPEVLSHPSLHPTAIFPTKLSQADIVFVGACPTFDDQKAGSLFAGAVGEKFDAILKAMGLSREKVHITTLLKHRPDAQNQTLETRDPSTEELESVRSLFAQEIAAVQPKVIIALGSIPCSFLCNSNASVETLRTETFEFNNTLVIPTNHPVHFLHKQNTPIKRAFWLDMLKVMELTQLPISDKQRGFFS